MLLENFRPRSRLVTKTTLVNEPRFRVIDAHNHLGEVFGGGWDKKPLSQLLDLVETYRICYRFLETDDEYFNYNSGDVPKQGRWHVHGLYLTDDVLKKVYSENARHVLGIG